MACGLFRFLVFLWLLLVAPVPPVLAQMQADRPAAAGHLSWDAAPVVIDGTRLFELRGASAYPAAERAARVGQRIIEIATDPSIDAQAIRIVPHALGLQLTVGDKIIVTLIDADAEYEGLKLDALADVVRSRIVESVNTYRSERSGKVLMERIPFAVLALVIAVAVLAGLLFLTRWMLNLIARHQDKVVEGVRIQSFRLVRADQVLALLRGMVQTLRVIVAVVIVCGCLLYILGLFPWTRFLADRIVAVLIDPLSVTLDAILSNVPNIVFILVIAILARIILRMTYVVFKATERGAIRFAGFEAEWAMPTYKIVRLLIVAFALVIAYPYIPGSDSAAFKGVSIFAGVILSLGSSSVISNVIAGYTMVYRQAFTVGDWIRVGEAAGEVVDMRLLVTHLRSWKNEALVLPNSQILNTEVINYSSLAREKGLILHPTVGIGYEVPWRQVEAMLIEAAKRTKGLRREPPPFVLEKALGDFAITYELNVHCEEPDEMPNHYAALHRNILDVFNEHGVQIMTPNYRADPETPKLVPKAHWYDPPAAAKPAVKSE